MRLDRCVSLPGFRFLKLNVMGRTCPVLQELNPGYKQPTGVDALTRWSLHPKACVYLIAEVGVSQIVLGTGFPSP